MSGQDGERKFWSLEEQNTFFSCMVAQVQLLTQEEQGTYLQQLILVENVCVVHSHWELGGSSWF